MGAGRLDFAAFYGAWELFLLGPVAKDGQRHDGAVDRDKKQSGWGQPGLAKELLEAIRQAAQLQQSRRSDWFESQSRELGPKVEERLRQWRKAKQAGLFVDSLVTMIRTEFHRRTEVKARANS